jgi:hypothetical protein
MVNTPLPGRANDNNVTYYHGHYLIIAYGVDRGVVYPSIFRPILHAESVTPCIFYHRHTSLKDTNDWARSEVRRMQEEFRHRSERGTCDECTGTVYSI